MPTRFAHIEELFHAALELAGDERGAYLDRVCGADPNLRREVDALLAADEEAEAFLGHEQRDALAGGFTAGALPRRLGPYRLLEVAGQGGMGLVLRAERADGAFEQQVAVKMLRPGPATDGLLARFRVERRVLARLEHPGIARVLDAGEDEQGAPWLAMEFVPGEPIDRWCDGRRLSLEARVRLFRDVLEAVTHAHEQLVVHRDLKPDNVLVDAAGRARLLDFGIAKVLADEEGDVARTRVDERALTPAYASPEQVRGEAVGPRSDVYSLGVVLYELLSGCLPYRASTQSRLLLERAVAEGDVLPPSAKLAAASECEAMAAARGHQARSLVRALRGDLDRIAARALAVDPARRYPSARDLDADLGRWLAGLPVEARGDGLGYRFGKLLRRRPLESALAAALLVGAAVGAGLFVRQSLVAGEQLATIERLADAQRLEELERELVRFSGADPSAVPHMEAWLERAGELLDRRGLHERTRVELAASPGGDEAQRAWRTWQAARLGELLDGIDALAAENPFGATIAAVAVRRTRAATLAERSIVSRAADWAAAAERVRANPRYSGLELAPQLGLVPLGPDPDGGLEAFFVLDSGAPPARDDNGRLRVGPECGLVLLLLPGGSFPMGAQAEDPAAPNFDPQAEVDEGPVHAVELSPFLLSKFEVTQGQWSAWRGVNPAEYLPGSRVAGGGFTLAHPVEQVSWIEAERALFDFGLELPTEAQWEYAARAGTNTPWSSGADERSLAGHANLADRHAAGHGGSPAWVYSDWLDDGHTVHAPVGSFAPNPFGLADMHGNVWEWVRDAYAPYSGPPRPGDGLRAALVPEDETSRAVARGGGFFNPPSALRSAERYPMRPQQATRSLGLRPARALDRH